MAYINWQYGLLGYNTDHKLLHVMTAFSLIFTTVTSGQVREWHNFLILER